MASIALQVPVKTDATNAQDMRCAQTIAIAHLQCLLKCEFCDVRQERAVANPRRRKDSECEEDGLRRRVRPAISLLYTLVTFFQEELNEERNILKALGQCECVRI